MPQLIVRNHVERSLDTHRDTRVVHVLGVDPGRRRTVVVSTGKYALRRRRLSARLGGESKKHQEDAGRPTVDRLALACAPAYAHVSIAPDAIGLAKHG